MKDLVEVCSLSRRPMFQTVSSRLQEGFRFFHIPLPAAPTAFLAVHLPSPAALRAYPVPHAFQSGAGPSISPAAVYPRWIIGKDPYLAAHLLVQAYQHLRLVWLDDVYQRFTCVGRIRSSLAPFRLDAGRVRLSSRFGVPNRSQGTSSPELHTALLPAPHVRVGNGWWNNRFRQVITPPVKQKIHATFRSHSRRTIAGPS